MTIQLVYFHPHTIVSNVFMRNETYPLIFTGRVYNILFHLFSVLNTPRKGMNPSILPTAMGKWKAILGSATLVWRKTLNSLKIELVLNPAHAEVLGKYILLHFFFFKSVGLCLIKAVHRIIISIDELSLQQQALRVKIGRSEMRIESVICPQISPSITNWTFCQDDLSFGFKHQRKSTD